MEVGSPRAISCAARARVALRDGVCIGSSARARQDLILGQKDGVVVVVVCAGQEV